jgi:glycerol-3-phosphate dehydrogenase
LRFSGRERERSLERLGAETFDVLVIGGGITGAGVALDAATRGLRTALVERGDFASGTSSRSSKLVHGGLRYLNQREFRLVYEALAERQRLLRLAPHLVRPLPFLIPIFGTGIAGNAGARAIARAMGTALWMYDMTGGARIGKLHRRLSKAETVARMPDLDTRRLAAGFLYYDARVDDARLTLAVVKTAAAHGAVAANYVEATGLVHQGQETAGPVGDMNRRRVGGVDSPVIGAVLTDRRTGARIEARSAVVVNAAGVWADQLRALDEGANQRSIRPAKGVHITLPAGRPRLDIAAVLPVPGDRRSIFVIPWEDRVYVGTTDTNYDGPLDDPVCTSADIDYLLGALNSWLHEPVHRSEVLGTWAGLRPLVGGGASEGVAGETPSRTADLSRRHAVRVSGSGLVTIIGGKLTTYRKMAEDTVDAVLEVGAPRLRRPAGRGGKWQSAGRGEWQSGRRGDKQPAGRGEWQSAGRGPRSRTGSVPLFGAEGYEELTRPGAAERLGLPAEALPHLLGRHGGHVRAVAAMVRDRPDLAAPLVPGLPYLRAEALYAVRYEMALTLEDVLSRRTRALLLDASATAEAAPEVARLLAEEIGWDAAEIEAQVASFQELVDRQRRAADPAEDAVEAQLLGPPAAAGGDI